MELSMRSEETENNYFRVECEFQYRARRIDPSELEVFRSVSMRPAPTVGVRNEVETLLRGSDLGEGMKTVVERSMAILMSIDQRLERIEEDISMIITGQGEKLQAYEWVAAEMGSKGFIAELPQVENPQVGEYILMDALLPTMPEHRIVATMRVDEVDGAAAHFKFDALHAEDEEFVFRFVRSREREILRSRKK